MKIKLSLLLLLLTFMAYSVQAQNVDIGKAMTELTSSLKPEAFKGSWKKNKDSWMEQASGLDISDLSGVSSQMTGLLSNLKKSAFKKGVQKGLLKQLATPKNAAELTEAFKSLVNGIDPSMFVSGFDRGGLLKNLGI
ncbi:hypothetical protein [Fulvivirga sedimenti]|uniref:DUF2780 domain-containing protein n=1 Tax=Fulvivirga sedimenti TaxID=2879465 RepID=A0A9X1KZA2_9BACT|nr:hypothetical protein [Fulvivirga sedimenti]MCA6074461.1 hypothetical protein [Fulvivirga sedimenti]